MRRPSEPAHLQLHQALGAVADHLAQKVCVRAHFQQRPQVHHVVGHLRSSCGNEFANPAYRRSLMTAAQPLARYGAMWKARVASGFASLELHHLQGHDLD
jgi:hypothetical protein